MRIQRLVLALALGFAVSIHFGAAQAVAQATFKSQPKPPKPPKPPKSDDHGPKGDHDHDDDRSQIEGGMIVSWIANVPATRTALATGLLTIVSGQALQTSCSETQTGLLGILVGTPSIGQAGCVEPIAPRSDMVRSLTEAGAPLAEASALANAMSGILSRPRPEQLGESVDRFNQLVMVAPDSFLKAPPPPFLAIHEVLARLLVAPNTK